MRDLETLELGSVYGAGCSPAPPSCKSKGSKGGKGSKGSKCKSSRAKRSGKIHCY
jgi:hypothetical protein